jgi:hypothetical protein
MSGRDGWLSRLAGERTSTLLSDTLGYVMLRGAMQLYPTPRRVSIPYAIWALVWALGVFIIFVVLMVFLSK